MGGSEASGEIGRREMDAYSALAVCIVNVLKVSKQPCEEIAITLSYR